MEIDTGGVHYSPGVNVGFLGSYGWRKGGAGSGRFSSVYPYGTAACALWQDAGAEKDLPGS